VKPQVRTMIMADTPKVKNHCGFRVPDRLARRVLANCSARAGLGRSDDSLPGLMTCPG